MLPNDHSPVVLGLSIRFCMFLKYMASSPRFEDFCDYCGHLNSSEFHFRPPPE